MKTNFSIAAAVAAALLLLPAASAQQTTNNNKQGKLLSASELKGSDVRNVQNEDIGDIDEVLIDSSSGKVRYVVLGVGGFLGLGETHVAVPWEAVRVSHDGNTARYVVDASKERLEGAASGRQEIRSTLHPGRFGADLHLLGCDMVRLRPCTGCEPRCLTGSADLAFTRGADIAFIGGFTDSGHRNISGSRRITAANRFAGSGNFSCPAHLACGWDDTDRYTTSVGAADEEK